MKKIFMAITLCLICAFSCFAQFSVSAYPVHNYTKIWGYNGTDKISYDNDNNCYIYEITGTAYLYDLGQDKIAPRKRDFLTFSTKTELIDFLEQAWEILQNKDIKENNYITFQNNGQHYKVFCALGKIGNVYFRRDNLCYFRARWVENRTGYVDYMINAVWFRKKIYKKLDEFENNNTGAN